MCDVGNIILNSVLTFDKCLDSKKIFRYIL
mgnify:CR=1 FL=1